MDFLGMPVLTFRSKKLSWFGSFCGVCYICNCFSQW